MTDHEMSIRDQFAVHCPDSWIGNNIPRTIGAIRDLMIKEGLIPKDRLHDDPLKSYNEEDYNKLVCLYRWKYADQMMALRGAKT